MKNENLIIALTAAIIVGFLTYLTGAFSAASFNITKWSLEQRSLTALFILFFILFTFFIFYLSDYND